MTTTSPAKAVRLATLMLPRASSITEEKKKEGCGRVGGAGWVEQVGEIFDCVYVHLKMQTLLQV